MQILSNKLSSSEAGALAQRERGDLVVSLSLVLPWTDIFGKHFMEKVTIPLLFHEDTMSGNWRLRQWRLYGIIVFGDRREMGHGIREGGRADDLRGCYGDLEKRTPHVLLLTDTQPQDR